MDIDGTFMPVAVELIDSVFPTSVTYFRNLGAGYDPSTGEVTQNVEQLVVSAGVLSRGRTEAGGVGEDYELRLWFQHSSSGLPFLPKTGDSIEYDNTVWKVTTVDPTYSSKGLIASKITARGN